MHERVDGIQKALERLASEAEQNCDRMNTIEAALSKLSKGSNGNGSKGPHVAPWVWSLMVSLGITAMGALYVTGQFNGKFEEFRQAVYQRLDRLERVYDGERHRGPENYSPPPVEIGPRPR